MANAENAEHNAFDIFEDEKYFMRMDRFLIDNATDHPL